MNKLKRYRCTCLYGSSLMEEDSHGDYLRVDEVRDELLELRGTFAEFLPSSLHAGWYCDKVTELLEKLK